jgi:hypothetical protein
MGDSGLHWRSGAGFDKYLGKCQFTIAYMGITTYS